MKSSKILFPAVCAVCCLLTVSCAVSNSLFESMSAVGEITGSSILSSVGKAGSAVTKASETITPEQEYYIGRAVAATLFESYTLYQNQKLTEYLNAVCGTLVINSSRPELFNGYHVAILDSDQINAFATSGGHILVTRGLLVNAIKTSRISEALLATAGAAMTLSGHETLQDVADVFDQSVNEIVTTLVNTGYSQSQEYDADAVALEIMYNAGYNPAAMTEMLTLLKERQPHSSGGFASTHPSAEKRLKKVREELPAYPDVSVPAVRQQRYNAAVVSL